MKPIEKAQELIKKFNVRMFQPEVGWFNDDLETKKHALLCIEEILDLEYAPNEPSSQRVYDFYSKVKIEITKS